MNEKRLDVVSVEIALVDVAPFGALYLVPGQGELATSLAHSYHNLWLLELMNKNISLFEKHNFT